MFSFIYNSSAISCADEAESSHCFEVSSEKKVEASGCHDSPSSESDSHSSNNCGCQCHGHFSKIVNMKDGCRINKLDPYFKSILFPSLFSQKLSGYLSRLDRPPIS